MATRNRRLLLPDDAAASALWVAGLFRTTSAHLTKAYVRRALPLEQLRQPMSARFGIA